MDWLKNFDNINKNKKAGCCPYCKSDNTDYTFKRISGNYGFGDIWCKDCKKAFHISRTIVSDKLLRDIEPPIGLSY